MSQILITGATGLIGKAIGKMLVRRGYELVVVSRQTASQVQVQLPFKARVITADLMQEELPASELKEVVGIIHLAGENVAGQRWTDSYKQKIIESRKMTTRHLLASFQKLAKPALEFYIGASATGLYPSDLEQAYDEKSLNIGSDFLAQVVQALEVEHHNFSQAFRMMRFTQLRLGVVHSLDGGMLAKLIPIFKMGGGLPLGRGSQFLSWVDIEDVVGIVRWLLEQSRWSPVYNVVSPEPVTQTQWSAELAKVLNRPLWPPMVPPWILRLVLGEQSQMILGSQKVLPKALLDQGYRFQFGSLTASLAKVQKAWGTSFYFSAEQFVPRPQDQVFAFFSEPRNLEKISPPELQFQVLELTTPQIQEGTKIFYQLRLQGLAMRWISQIVDWTPPYRFTDIQIKGPYRSWHHTHFIEPVPGGVLIRDQVLYNHPLWILGDWFGYLFVRSQLHAIFDYRRKRLDELLLVQSRSVT